MHVHRPGFSSHLLAALLNLDVRLFFTECKFPGATEMEAIYQSSFRSN